MGYFRIGILLIVSLFVSVSWAQATVASDGTFTWDIDGDNAIVPSNDGLLVLRYLFGFRGESLINGAINVAGTRTTATLIEAYISEHLSQFDIDNDGQIKPLTDGLLLMRYQLGQRDQTLLNGAVSATGTRKDAIAIGGYIDDYYPEPPPVIALQTSVLLVDYEYFSAQSLTLSVNDEAATIYYRFANDEFKPYTTPLLLASGKEYLLEYYAVGEDGRTEEKQSKAYRIWSVVDQSGQGDYLSLYDAVNAVAKPQRIWIKEGAYAVNKTIEIRYSDVVVKGESQANTILQKTTPHSLLLVIDTDHVTVENVTLDAKTHDNAAETDAEKQIWEAFGVLDSDYVTLKNTKVMGSYHMFAIYFSGPTKTSTGEKLLEGQPVLDAFEADNLDAFNVVDGNTIIASSNKLDVLSFSLQKNGKVINNHQTGGLISFYMNNGSICNNNVIEDSDSVGIYLSIPAHNNEVDGNTIRNAKSAGIKVERQSDHRASDGTILTPTSYRGKANKITNNTIIDAHFSGIEVSQLEGGIVSGNRIETPDYNGIHITLSDNTDIFGNSIIDGDQAKNRTPIHDFSPATGGVFLDQYAVGTKIHDNTITNTANGRFDHAVHITNWETISGSSIITNRFEGSYSGGVISTGVNTDSANVHSNVSVP